MSGALLCAGRHGRAWHQSRRCSAVGLGSALHTGGPETVRRGAGSLCWRGRQSVGGEHGETAAVWVTYRFSVSMIHKLQLRSKLFFLRLPLASHSASTFDWVLSCVAADSSSIHSSESLTEMARVLKPGGKLVLEELVTGERPTSLKVTNVLFETLQFLVLTVCWTCLSPGCRSWGSECEDCREGDVSSEAVRLHISDRGEGIHLQERVPDTWFSGWAQNKFESVPFASSLNKVCKSELSPEALKSFTEATGYQGNTLSRVRVYASKPNYEVGSSSQIKLNFGKKTAKPGGFISTGFVLITVHLLGVLFFCVWE